MAPLVAVLLIALLLVAATWLRRQFTVVRVVGSSMQPTLAPGDRVLARRRPSRRFRAGQVVVVRRTPGDLLAQENADQPSALIMKRVAATAGASVRPEWIPAELRQSSSRVPAGMLVLLGDNTKVSRDSRQLGYFSASDVLGVVVRRMR